MASESDIRRARNGALNNLANLETLSEAAEASRDDELRRLLGGIGQRRSDQMLRLLDWMYRQGAGGGAAAFSTGAATEPPGVSPAVDGAGQARDSDEYAEQTVSRPDTGVGGVSVLERREVTPELIQFIVPRPRDFDFVAGQSVKVGVGDVRRSFSIVSAPHEPVLEFFVELVPGGQMSEQLRRMKTGDRITLGPPKGGLRFDAGYPNHLMVSTVTGVNPFISILREYLHHGRSGHRFHVLQGASYQNEFGYREELERLATAHPDVVSYVPTISRPDETVNLGWAGHTGRVDGLVTEYLQKTGLDGGSTLSYACGHSGMLEAVERQLAPLGFEVRTENYD